MEAGKANISPFKPPPHFIENSRARLNALFSEKFTIRQAAYEQQQPFKNLTYTQLRKSAGDDSTAKALVQEGRQRSIDFIKKGSETPNPRKLAPRDNIDAFWTPPYTWDWTWSAQSGQDPLAIVSANRNNGTLSFTIDSGLNGKTASAAVAVGNYFRPTNPNGVMYVGSVPSINYQAWAEHTFDSSHSHTFIGIYVGEYTLEGQFVQAVVDQQLQIEDTTGGDPSGKISGYSLLASTPVDSDHFYEVWVWAGGDCEGDGWSVFWGSEAGATMNIAVPSISINAF